MECAGHKTLHRRLNVKCRSSMDSCKCSGKRRFGSFNFTTKGHVVELWILASFWYVKTFHVITQDGCERTILPYCGLHYVYRICKNLQSVVITEQTVTCLPSFPIYPVQTHVQSKWFKTALLALHSQWSHSPTDLPPSTLTFMEKIDMKEEQHTSKHRRWRQKKPIVDLHL